MADPAWHRTGVDLRYCDQDPVGHVNNAVYASLLEAGRVAMLRECGVFERNPGLSGVLVRVEIDFRREMHYPGVAVVHSAVQRFGTKSMTIRHRVEQDDALRAEGVSVLAILDTATRRTVPLDDAVRAGFARWALPPG